MSLDLGRISFLQRDAISVAQFERYNTTYRTFKSLSAISVQLSW